MLAHLDSTPIDSTPRSRSVKITVVIDNTEIPITNDKEKNLFYQHIRNLKLTYQTTSTKLLKLMQAYGFDPEVNVNAAIDILFKKIKVCESNIAKLNEFIHDEMIEQLDLNASYLDPQSIHSEECLIKEPPQSKQVNVNIKDVEDNKFEKVLRHYETEKIKLISQMTELKNAKHTVDTISKTLDTTISFSAGRRINVEWLKIGLGFEFSSDIVDAMLKCQWQKINLSYEQMILILVKFGKYAEDQKISTNNYITAFEEFIKQNAVPIEHEIKWKNIEKLRFLDSLARFINYYLRYISKINFNSVISAAFWKNNLIITSNDTIDENLKSSYCKGIDKALKHLATIIDWCLSDELEGQATYVNTLFNNGQFHNYINIDQKNFPPRIHHDLLNILQFSANQKKYARQLLQEQLRENHQIYIHCVKTKQEILPAGSVLLKHLICDYLISYKKGRPLALLPKDPILIGGSKLDCAQGHQLIEALNAPHFNIDVVTTGTHLIKYCSKELNIIGLFFDHILLELNKPSLNIAGDHYANITAYLNEMQSSLQLQMKPSVQMKFCSIRSFTTRNGKVFHPLLDHHHSGTLGEPSQSPRLYGRFFKPEEQNTDEDNTSVNENDQSTNSTKKRRIYAHDPTNMKRPDPIFRPTRQ